MRILFRDQREQHEYSALAERIRRWWKEFEAKTGSLDQLFSRRCDWDLVGWMDEYLHAVDPRLCWEFGPGLRNGHRLVITPESERQLRPLVNCVLQAAPSVPGWQFLPYRPPESLREAAASVSGRAGGSIEDVRAEVREGPLNTVALRLVSPRYLAENQPDDLREAFVAVESLLGEEVLDNWVGPIDTGPARADRRAIPLDRLRPTVDALIGHIREQMPQVPCARRLDGDTWGTYTMRCGAMVKRSPDYPERADMVAGVTMYWDMLQAAHNGGAFCSERFSIHGETFCYIKIDCIDGLAGSRWKDRGEIQDAVHRELAGHGLGTGIGGGTGQRYAYIDLALADLQKGAEVVMSALRKGRVPRRSWLLFFDATLKEEWVGVDEETPPPCVTA